MKDIQNLTYFLGNEVLRSEKGFLLIKEVILDLLAGLRMIDCKIVERPSIVNRGLQIIEGKDLTDKGQYQRIVGNIFISHKIGHGVCGKNH